MENWSDWWKTGQIGGFVGNWSDWWKTGQIGGFVENWSDWWKIGQIDGKLVRLVENWSDWWICGKLVRLVENWTKKLTRSTGGKVAKVPRLCTKVGPRQGGNGRKNSQTGSVTQFRSEAPYRII